MTTATHVHTWRRLPRSEFQRLVGDVELGCPGCKSITLAPNYVRDVPEYDPDRDGPLYPLHRIQGIYSMYPNGEPS